MACKSFVRLIVLAAALTCAFSPTQIFGEESQSKSDVAKPEEQKIADQMAALTAALIKLKPGEFEKLEGAPDQLQPLVEALSNLSYDFSDKSARAMGKAAATLKENLAGASPTTKKFLQQDGATVENLNTLLLTIQDLKLTDAGLVVRVKEAKFGDTPERPVIKKRWCDATAYMRAKCDRRLNCALEPNYQDLVCGFNPAPSAEARNRGLYVDYECVPNVEANFVGTYGVSGTLPTTELLKNPDRSKYVVLRGNGSLVCGVASSASVTSTASPGGAAPK